MLEQLFSAPTEYDALAKTFMKYKLMSDVGDMALKGILPKNQDETLNTRLKQLQVYQLEKGFGIPDSQKFEDSINNDKWDTAKFLASRGGFKYLDKMPDWRPVMPSGPIDPEIDQELVNMMIRSELSGNSPVLKDAFKTIRLGSKTPPPMPDLSKFMSDAQKVSDIVRLGPKTPPPEVNIFKFMSDANKVAEIEKKQKPFLGALKAFFTKRP